ncbi:hypothetical protein Agabi119p4_2862 [Agaricus bisporus var. burnettii]|uniref:Uncharacterized protein n=1 Tax=Agaricus bisporus var. burnettii TaxID=192524 RepID=A0A8H7F5Z7_AGABI|nr:hypothetical protein Agabi119p4_2862 [Agaricus bisporus var. burnettii]
MAPLLSSCVGRANSTEFDSSIPDAPVSGSVNLSRAEKPQKQQPAQRSRKATEMRETVAIFWITENYDSINPLPNGGRKLFGSKF